MTEHPVIFSLQDSVATIRLNRPQTLNAMNDALMSGITAAVGQVVDDKSIRALIVTGEGRGFCAGADLAAMAAGPGQEADAAPTASSSDSSAADGIFNTAMRALMNCPVPTIARINGPAAGGGFGLALACDITIAAESAFFVATFGPRLGIVPDLGTTWSVPLRVGRARALGITLLGERITAKQAQEWGLIWQAVPDADLDEAVAGAAAVLKRSSPGTMTRIRSTIDAAIHNTFSEQLNLEMEHQAELIPRNMMEGAVAFVEKRDPQFSGERH